MTTTTSGSSPAVDLDSILGNRTDSGVYEEEERRLAQEHEQDRSKRRNAVVGWRPVEEDREDESSTFFTGLDSAYSDTRRKAAVSFDESVFARSASADGDLNARDAHSTNAALTANNTADSANTTRTAQSSNAHSSGISLTLASELLLGGLDPAAMGAQSGSGFSLPGGLALSETKTNKYFGPQARTNFFDQFQALQQKRQICGSQSDFSYSADLSYSMAVAKGGKNSALNKMINDLPFQPDRPAEQPLRLNTRVIIRTQSLGDGNAYAQMKLIEKPKHLHLDRLHESEDSEGEEDEEEEAKEEVFHTRSRSERLPALLLPPALHIAEASKKATPISTPSNRAGRHAPSHQKAKPSSHVLKLKPLVTGSNGKARRSLSIATTTDDSARSTDSKHSDARRFSTVNLEEKHDSGHGNAANTIKTAGTPKHGHVKRHEHQSSPNEKPYHSDTKGKNRRVSIDVAKKANHAQEEELSMQHMAQIYKERVAHEQKIAKANRKTRDVGELDEDSLVPAMELICVDYRDALNKKIADKLNKKNSLFQYVEAKTAKRDFYDLSDHSDESDEDIEISLWGESSPISPLRMIPSLQSPSSEKTQRRRFLRKKKEGDILQGSPALPPITPDDTALSPRSRFIDSCIRQRLNPRASLILRKTFTRELNLRHLGMGDEMAVLLAEAIVSVPHIQSLNVCDNNLHDKGLSSIVYAICNMKDLVHLDMSMNEIGPSAALSLDNYLRRPECPLVSLVLRKADVDDDECRDFVRALEHNKNLRTLDLSENLVGSSENLNTVMPDLVTGGEALAELLSSPHCPLTTLRLGWNMIRLGGAMSLCASLAVNSSLTYLELSFNSLGASGGVALGDALQENKVLKTLLLANNSLDSIACLTICAGILENEALSEISFDGNPIGEQGAKVLMLLPTIVGSRVSVSAKTCNTTMRDPRNWFDTASLVRKFELNLSEPFERAIAIILLFLVPSHQTYIAAQCEYLDPSTNQWVDLKLKETIDLEHFEKRPLEPEQALAIANLRKVKEATKDINKAKEFFEEIDEDGSGQLDEHEFANLMAEIGMDTSEEKVREVMNEYDVDGGGVIEMAEFLIFLKNQRKEADKRLRELTEFPILVSETLDAAVRYNPPRTGQLRLSIIDGFAQKETYRVISPGDRVNILKIAGQSGELLTMTSFGMKNYKIRFDEAVVLATQLLRETNNKVKVLAKLLPQMSSPLDARALVARLLGQNLVELARLKIEVGQSFRVLMGQPDGFYSLDLSNEMDRFCVNRLLEIGMTVCHRRSLKRDALGYGRLGDTSQKGNFSGFRNEMLNKKPVVVSVEFASPLPRTGKLEFDFVSQRRFHKDNFALNDIRFTNLLVKTFQLNPRERPKLITHLRAIRKHCDRSLEGNGKTVFEFSKQQAGEVGVFMETFYAKLGERSEQYERYKAKENVRAQWEYDPVQLPLTPQSATVVFTVPYLYKTSVQKYSSRSSMLLSTRASAIATASSASAKTDSSLSAALRSVSEVFPTESLESKSCEAHTTTEKALHSDYDRLLSFEQAEEALGEIVFDAREDEDFDEDFALADRPVAQEPNTLQANRSTKISDVSLSAKTNEGSTKQKSSRSSFLAAVSRTSVVSSTSEQIVFADVVKKVMSINQVEEARAKAQYLPEVWTRYVCLMGSKNIPPHAKAAKTLELLLDTFETQFIFARHLELLVILFKTYGGLKNSDDFGTYRVDLVVLLFPCVVDLHNIEIVFRQMTSFEVACVRCRVGFLNIFNPMKPEGSYELDLSRREERLIVKMLAQLSVVEPGDNLPFLQFRWERDMDPMPGYELTEPWLTEAGLPNKGLWNVTYYSGQGVGKDGCKPVVKLRKSMLQLVLIEEEEFITEKDREDDVSVPLVGPSFIKSNPGIWVSYLAYNEADFQAYQEKKGNASADKELPKK